METGSRAAARGGFTAVVAMPNTTPAIDSAGVVREVQALGRPTPSAPCTPPAPSPSAGRGSSSRPWRSWPTLGVRLFTDDGNGVQDDRLMRRAMEYASGLPHDVVLAQHCEVEALADGGHMHEGAWSSRLGIPGIPAAAEELMVARDLALARLTGARVHFQHMSTAGSVELIRQAKADGLRCTPRSHPTTSRSPTPRWPSFDPIFKVNPPLREQADVDAVRAGLVDGTLDAVATDHAPHTQEDKEKPFDAAPPGMLGPRVRPGPRPHRGRPARRAGAGGPVLAARRPSPAWATSTAARSPRVGPANLCVIDPTREWTVDPADSASRSRNNPYAGRKLHGPGPPHRATAASPSSSTREAQR